MDLCTSYLGLELRHPLMPGASPLVDDLDEVRRLEDAGASAIVMHSLFEEQLRAEHLSAALPMNGYEEFFSPALALFPNWVDFKLGPDEYLEQLHRIRACVDVPVIGSLNGSTGTDWLHFGRLMQQAGADAVELTLGTPAPDFDTDSATVEAGAIGMLEIAKEHLAIPVAVKLSPHYSALPNFALRLERAGADGLVLFNRFLQPDIDVERLDVRNSIEPSTPSELRLRLGWLALLSGRIRSSLAASGGVHRGEDAIKAVMAGAHAVQIVSALLQHGAGHLAVVRREMVEWLERNEIESLGRLRGCMSLRRCPHTGAYERANYLETLQSWSR